MECLDGGCGLPDFESEKQEFYENLKITQYAIDDTVMKMGYSIPLEIPLLCDSDDISSVDIRIIRDIPELGFGKNEYKEMYGYLCEYWVAVSNSSEIEHMMIDTEEVSLPEGYEFESNYEFLEEGKDFVFNIDKDKENRLLTRMMERYVEREEYEIAAELRDRIKK